MATLPVITPVVGTPRPLPMPVGGGTNVPPPIPQNGQPPADVIAALTSGVVEIHRRAEIYEQDAETPFDIEDWNGRLTDGSVTVDGTRDERRMCDFTFANDDFALNLNPVNGFWYDKIIKAFWGIEYTDSAGNLQHWEIQIGEFMIDRIDEDYFPHTTHVTGRDYTKKCLLSEIAQSIQFSSQTPVETIVTALAANAGVAKFRMPYTGLAYSDDVVYDAGTARWEVMKGVADSVGYEVYFTADGYLTMRPYQDPVLSPQTFVFTVGNPDGTLVTYSRSSDDSQVKNHCLVFGATVTDDSGLSHTAFGEARNDDPSSPTNIARIGDRVDTFKSDVITDQTQAQTLAEQRLRVMALEEYSIDFSSMIIPWIDSNDIVDIINPNESLFVPARFLLSNFTLPMALGPMTGTGKRVTIVGTERQLGVY